MKKKERQNDTNKQRHIYIEAFQVNTLNCFTRMPGDQNEKRSGNGELIKKEMRETSVD